MMLWHLPSDCGVCTVGDDPRVVLGDHAAVVFLLVDVVDHVSLHRLNTGKTFQSIWHQMSSLLTQFYLIRSALFIFRTDNINLVVLLARGPLVDIYDVIRVGNEKSKNIMTKTFINDQNIFLLHWIGRVPVKVRQNVVSKDQWSSKIKNV